LGARSVAKRQFRRGIGDQHVGDGGEGAGVDHALGAPLFDDEGRRRRHEHGDRRQQGDSRDPAFEGDRSFPPHWPRVAHQESRPRRRDLSSPFYQTES
jgi:hypothetical protein